MLEAECKENCEKCIQYTSPIGEIKYKCSDDISKSKVILIVASVFGGIGFIIIIYVSVLLIMKCKKKKKELIMKVNHMTPGFDTYFNLQDKPKIEPNKEKDKSMSSESKEIEVAPIQPRIEQASSEHTNQIIIYSLNNSNMQLKTKSKLLLNTVMPQEKRWNYQVNSPSPRVRKKLQKSISPNKKNNIPRDRRKSHFFENNKIGRMVDKIMQNSH